MLELSHVARDFGEIRAVKDATVEFPSGLITAVIGENGAGKSTLLKMGAGLLEPSSGSVLFDGKALPEASPAAALRLGIGMVHQHFMLIGTFTALENVVLGHEPVEKGRLDLASARRKTQKLMEQTGLTLDLDSLTDELTVGERQRLEILRVLYRGATVMLLDEPTAVLSPLEAEELYGVLRSLADEGRAIVVVTHRLDEVVKHADRVVVMRRGEVVHSDPAEATKDRAPMDEAELTRKIMGKEPPAAAKPPPFRDDAELVLEVKGVSFVDAVGRKHLDGLDLRVRAGELVGIAGVEGNGQRELSRVLSGLVRPSVGKIRIGGTDRTNDDVSERRKRLGTVHEDRHAEGLVLEATVHDNLVLGEVAALGEQSEDDVVRRRIDAVGIVPPDPSLPAAALSGGNQQKIVTGRVFDRMREVQAHGAAVMVLSQPTRGVDVGAASTIHEAITAAAKSGIAVVIISADLSELRRLSHRILVLRRGSFVAELPPSASDEKIGRAMLGLEAA